MPSRKQERILMKSDRRRYGYDAKSRLSNLLFFPCRIFLFERTATKVRSRTV